MYWPGGVRHKGGVNVVCGFRRERGKAGVDNVLADVRRGKRVARALALSFLDAGDLAAPLQYRGT